jgi:hypothetical protein
MWSSPLSAIRRPFLTVPEAIETLATARRLAREGVDTHDLQLAAQEFIDEEAERLRRVRAKPRVNANMIVFALVPACILLVGWIDQVPL